MVAKRKTLSKLASAAQACKTLTEQSVEEEVDTPIVPVEEERIMRKRSAQVAGGAAAKKGKVDIAFAGIQDTLNKAEHLPASCRAMLAAMVPASLATPSEQRSKQQATVIEWIEDVLQKHRCQLSSEADAVTTKLSQLQATKAEHLASVEKAEAAVAEKKEVVPVKRNFLAEATDAVATTKKLLAEKQEERNICDADFLAMQEEQEGLASAFVEHFKIPLEAGEALHYEELKPFLRKLDLQESFMVSLPASCSKTKELRGAFDEIVLQTLEQELLDRAATIKDVVSNPNAEREARNGAIQKTEEQLAAEGAAVEKATEELSAAEKDVELADAALREIERGAATVTSEVKASAKLCDKLRFVLEGFEAGPLRGFKSFKEGSSAAELGAVAGS